MTKRIRHPTTNRKIAGSSPARIKFCLLRRIFGCNTECKNVKGAGLSNTVSITKGPVAKWIRHPTTNRKIAGSNPARIKFCLLRRIFDCNTEVWNFF